MKEAILLRDKKKSFLFRSKSFIWIWIRVKNLGSSKWSQRRERKLKTATFFPVPNLESRVEYKWNGGFIFIFVFSPLFFCICSGVKQFNFTPSEHWLFFIPRQCLKFREDAQNDLTRWIHRIEYCNFFEIRKISRQRN